MEEPEGRRRELTFECPLCAKSCARHFTCFILIFIATGIITVLQIMKQRLIEAMVTQLAYKSFNARTISNTFSLSFFFF